MIALTRLAPDGRLYLNGRHVGWLDRYPPDLGFRGAWRARTAAGSSLGVFPTRAAAVRAVLTQKELVDE